MKKALQLPSFLPRIITLLYHRVDTSETDPWGICVSIEKFEEQIQFLKNNFNIISSGDLIKQVTNHNITGGSICLTFDDGYADNYTNAKPILEKYNCPATFFISTAFIGSTIPFWWEELEIILLHSIKLPGKLLLEIGGEEHSYTFDESRLTDKQLLQHANWKWYEYPPTDRCKIFLKIWGKLKVLLIDAIETNIEVLRKWASSINMGNSRLPMNDHQVSELSKNPKFTIAMHTHTHPDLKEKEITLQTEEMLSCKKILNTKYSVDSNCLAYPYGQYDSNTIKAVNNMGIEACFTTSPSDIYAYSDRRILGRYQVFNESRTSLKNRLNLLKNF